MSWIVEGSISFLQRFCINVLKCGPIPKHVAFIMDGNRRFARKANVPKVIGHTKGFDKLAETLQWCLQLGITEVTVYAFSIENFKRSSAEVDDLMNLAIEKFKKLLEEKDKIMEQGVCVRIIGNMNLLHEDLRKLIAEVILMTKNNNKTFLNLAFAYTSREEITQAVKTIVYGVEKNDLSVSDIDETLISDCLYTNSSKDPDLLIRTSGEVRLSDFLLWQVHSTVIYFSDVLWPEFSLWNFLVCVFHYQRCQITSKNKRVQYASCRSENAQTFLLKLEENKMNQLQSYANS